MGASGRRRLDEAMVTELKPKSLGLIWLVCSSPMLAFRLEKAVEAHAYVHREARSSQNEAPLLSWSTS